MSKSKAQKEAAAQKRAAALTATGQTPADASTAPAEGEALAEVDTDDEGDDLDDETTAEDAEGDDSPILGEINDEGEIVAADESEVPAASISSDTPSAFSKATEETPLPIEPPGRAAEEPATREATPTAKPAPDPAAAGFADSVLNEVAPAVREESPAPEAPALGTVLRCNNFAPGISADEPFGITGTVVKAMPNGKQIAVVLEIPSLGIRWPVDTRFIRGAFWEHDTTPGVYPAPGAFPDFDARFRTTAAKATQMAFTPAVKAFKAPRAARRGHAWAKCVGDSVGAPGFTLKDGETKQRTWTKDEIGEIPLVAIEPHHFVKVG